MVSFGVGLSRGKGEWEGALLLKGPFHVEISQRECHQPRSPAGGNVRAPLSPLLSQLRLRFPAGQQGCIRRSVGGGGVFPSRPCAGPTRLRGRGWVKQVPGPPGSGDVGCLERPTSWSRERLQTGRELERRPRMPPLYSIPSPAQGVQPHSHTCGNKKLALSWESPGVISLVPPLDSVRISGQETRGI